MNDLRRGRIDQFSKLRALVLGDAMLDTYLCGTSTRLCPEGPAPRVDVVEQGDLPGGAANCAANLAALGAQVAMLSVAGDDAEGQKLQQLLARRGVTVEDFVLNPRRRTLHKTRVLCDEHMLVRFDRGTTYQLSGELEERMVAGLHRDFAAADLVLVSDYGYGLLTPRLIEVLAALQRARPKLLAVDSKTLRAFRHVGVTVCKPNFREALRLLGHDPASREDPIGTILKVGPVVLEETNAQIAAVTIDRDGAVVFERNREPYRTLSRSAPARRVSGAGDTFLATLALGLAAGASTPEAADLATAASAVVVQKDFTAVCSAAELGESLIGERKTWTSTVRLAPILAQYRQQGRRIVLTNGCFDILHQGHIKYLNEAKRLGDVLIVGVNTDDSIRRLKGLGRPINSLADRVEVLAALSCVDHVVAFDEDTPHRIVAAIRPDVFVKGGDYTRETLPEAGLVEQLGGVVRILPFVANRSTTGIIDRICRNYGAPEHQGSEYHGQPLDQCETRAVR